MLIIGVIHLPPLPGTPFCENSNYDHALDYALRSAQDLEQGGAGGCLLQTVDGVYRRDDCSDPARIAALSCITKEVVSNTTDSFKVGVQLMRNDIKSSLAIASVCGGQFIRATALIGGARTDYGMITTDPYDVAVYRKYIQAEKIDMIVDIASIHHRSDRDIIEQARHSVRMGATSLSIGLPDKKLTLDFIHKVRSVLPEIPIYIAGHTNHANASELLKEVNGAFVSNCFTDCGLTKSIDRRKVMEYMDIVRSI